MCERISGWQTGVTDVATHMHSHDVTHEHRYRIDCLFTTDNLTRSTGRGHIHRHPNCMKTSLSSATISILLAAEDAAQDPCRRRKRRSRRVVWRVYQTAGHEQQRSFAMRSGLHLRHLLTTAQRQTCKQTRAAI